MHIDHHPLTQDFPEFHAQIHFLKENDHHFAKLAAEYEVLDKQICRIEDSVDTLNEDALHALKQQRVNLKDELYRLLKKSTKPCCGSCCG